MKYIKRLLEDRIRHTLERNKSVLLLGARQTGKTTLRANGEAINKFMMTKYVERGDTIVIPQEFKYWTPPGQLLKDTVEVLSRIAIGVGIIAALQ